MNVIAEFPLGIGDPWRLFDLLFGSSPYGLVCQDAASRIIASNEAARRILGLDREQLERRDSYDDRWRTIREDGSEYPPEEHPAVAVLRGGEPVRDSVMGVWNAREERFRWMLLNAIPWRAGESGPPDLALVWIEDVTARVDALRSEARSIDRFHSLFDHMIEGVALHHVVRDESGAAIDYRIIEVNARYEAHVGIPREKAVGRLGSEVYGTSPAPYIPEFCGAADSKRPYQFDTYFPPLDKHFRISVAPFDEDGFATIFFDISELKRTQTERERLVAELERKNKELESIVYAASHDLRAPLVNIQGFGQRLERDCAELATKAGAVAASLAAIEAAGSPGRAEAASERERARNEAAERARAAAAEQAHAAAAEQANAAAAIAAERIPRSLEFIRASGTKMDRLISGLLRLSRTGRIELIRERLDMDRLLREITASMAFQLESAGAEISVGPLPPCLGDAEQIGQIFSNLLDNAVKYRSPDRPVRIEVSGERRGRESRYVVADTGMGIAPEHLEKVWELFYRLEPGRDAGGEGLGLSLVRRIADRHGGRAFVESEPGVGSRFFVDLPSGEA